MAPKKSFKSNAVANFISVSEEVREEVKEEEHRDTIPTGYHLARDSKSERMQLLIRPGTKAAIKERAEAQRISVNELINQILEEYIERNGK